MDAKWFRSHRGRSEEEREGTRRSCALFLFRLGVAHCYAIHELNFQKYERRKQVFHAIFIFTNYMQLIVFIVQIGIINSSVSGSSMTSTSALFIQQFSLPP